MLRRAVHADGDRKLPVTTRLHERDRRGRRGVAGEAAEGDRAVVTVASFRSRTIVFAGSIIRKPVATCSRTSERASVAEPPLIWLSNQANWEPAGVRGIATRADRLGTGGVGRRGAGRGESGPSASWGIAGPAGRPVLATASAVIGTRKQTSAKRTPAPSLQSRMRLMSRGRAGISLLLVSVCGAMCTRYGSRPERGWGLAPPSRRGTSLAPDVHDRRTHLGYAP